MVLLNDGIVPIARLIFFVSSSEIELERPSLGSFNTLDIWTDGVLLGVGEVSSRLPLSGLVFGYSFYNLSILEGLLVVAA